MASYKILSLDGGGIRGLLTTIILERLNLLNPGWLDKVDLLAGTSTGGIIALGLAHGLTPTQLRNLYQMKGEKIFDDSWLDDLKDMGGLTGADYDNKNLKRELKKIFGLGGEATDELLFDLCILGPDGPDDNISTIT